MSALVLHVQVEERGQILIQLLLCYRSRFHRISRESRLVFAPNAPVYSVHSTRLIRIPTQTTLGQVSYECSLKHPIVFVLIKTVPVERLHRNGVVGELSAFCFEAKTQFMHGA